MSRNHLIKFRNGDASVISSNILAGVLYIIDEIYKDTVSSSIRLDVPDAPYSLLSIGQTISINTSQPLVSSFNYDRMYTISSIDSINKYIYVKNSLAYAALASGTGTVFNSNGILVIESIQEGEPIYDTKSNCFTFGSTSYNTYMDSATYGLSNQYQLKSPQIRNVYGSGNNFLPPINQGNNSMTLTKNSIYYVPFIVNNTTTFSTLTFYPKTNGSTSWNIGIYSSNKSDQVSYAPYELLFYNINGSTSASFDLRKTNANMINNYGTSNHLTTGIQLTRGVYWIGIQDNAGTTTSILNAGFGTGFIDTIYGNQYPTVAAGCLVADVGVGGTNLADWFGTDQPATSIYCPLVVMKAASVP